MYAVKLGDRIANINIGNITIISWRKLFFVAFKYIMFITHPTATKIYAKAGLINENSPVIDSSGHVMPLIKAPAIPYSWNRGIKSNSR